MKSQAGNRGKQTGRTLSDEFLEKIHRIFPEG